MPPTKQRLEGLPAVGVVEGDRVEHHAVVDPDLTRSPVPKLEGARTWAEVSNERRVSRAAGPTSERKRITIAREDESVITWWEVQRDPGLSVRQLIRAEIERTGFIDFANKPVQQLPQ